MDGAAAGTAPRTHSVSIVIPVYQGERTLAKLLGEIESLTTTTTSTDGHQLRVDEVLLVHDNGPDDSATVLRMLGERYAFVRTIWLSRNFGQHSATLAGMASTGGDWIVTMDEDGQHDPASLPDLLDVAIAEHADLVYGSPSNEPPHGVVRNLASRSAKRVIRLTTGEVRATEFQSFRLVLGEVGRSVAAYAGPGVYLDVAMGWVTRRVASCPVTVRDDNGRPSGYSIRSLSSHFWRMVLSSGTRALRMVSLLGVVFAAGGFLLAIYFTVARLAWHAVTPPGWPSLMVVLLVCSGAILFSLGVIAEYIGVAVNMAMGKPLYLIVSDPAHGPLGAAAGRRGAIPAGPGGAVPSDAPSPATAVPASTAAISPANQSTATPAQPAAAPSRSASTPARSTGGPPAAR